jgi:hypothetical protein
LLTIVLLLTSIIFYLKWSRAGTGMPGARPAQGAVGLVRREAGNLTTLDLTQPQEELNKALGRPLSGGVALVDSVR